MTPRLRDATLHASAPGRICLFGEHQDYLGLPVIAAAIDLRIRLTAKRIDERRFELELTDLGERRVLLPDEENAYASDRDYLAAAVNVLRREGVEWPGGLRVVVSSAIPINSGASSSSALQVAWCALLLAAAGDPRATDAEAVARLAHRSEVVEFQSPGGMMDHFACAVGGAIWLDCRPPYAVEQFANWPGEFLLVDSGIPKDTNGTLGERRRLLEELAVDFASLPLSSEPSAQLVTGRSAEEAGALRATIGGRHLTHRARELFMAPNLDQRALGQLLTEHHAHLSERLGVSLPVIDDDLRAGLALGALGGKINGSGCGGSFFFLCPGRGEALRQHFAANGRHAYVVRIGAGLEVSQIDPTEALLR